MKNITVGLDFGTHQTKICIENAEIPSQKTYEFFEFWNENSRSFFLPSIVQINLDNTLSYGFVRDSDCRVVNVTNEDLPVEVKLPPVKISESIPLKRDYPLAPPLPLFPTQPKKLEYPAEPNLSSKSKDWKDQLRVIKNQITNNSSEHLNDWSNECRRVDFKNKRKFEDWEFNCLILRTKYDHLYKDWQQACAKIDEEFEQELKLFDKRCEDNEIFFNEEMKKFQLVLAMQDYLIRDDSNHNVVFEKLTFKNFKIAVFSDDFEWAHTIDSDIISVWYITNIIFQLKAKVGEDFAIQMGVPRSIDRFFSKKQEVKALCILVASFNLYEKFDSYNSFLKADYLDLIQKTAISDVFLESDLNLYRLNVVPEAYAGLVALTRKNKLPMGMNLLVDIGGGSCDIAFFTIDNKTPDVYAVSSIHKGLNLLYGSIAAVEEERSIHEIQRIAVASEDVIKGNLKEVELLNAEIRSRVLMILSNVRRSFNKSPGTEKLDIGILNKALENRPIVYSGGGANLKMLTRHIDKFTDIRRVTQDSFPYGSLVGVLPSEELMSILCTSFGLSIPLEEDINLKDISDLFAHLDDGHGSIGQSDNDYGLIDT